MWDGQTRKEYVWLNVDVLQGSSAYDGRGGGWDSGFVKVNGGGCEGSRCGGNLGRRL